MVLWPPLNGLDRPLMVLWPSFWDFEWYRGPLSWDLKWYSRTLAETGPEWHYGPFSGISSGIQGALSRDSKRYSKPEWY